MAEASKPKAEKIVILDDKRIRVGVSFSHANEDGYLNNLFVEVVLPASTNSIAEIQKQAIERARDIIKTFANSF